ncbi:MAG: outer membrane protein assembly factor BamE domain-containing protein [Planctomycetota bacterium]|jgi:hypothetical protein
MVWKKVLIATAFLVFFVGCARRKQPEKWTNREAWGKLKKGMTEQQVVELIGKPKQKIRRGGMKWYYQEAPRKIRGEPSHGWVLFLGSQKLYIVSWHVHSWKEPDWEKVEAEMIEAESE